MPCQQTHTPRTTTLIHRTRPDTHTLPVAQHPPSHIRIPLAPQLRPGHGMAWCGTVKHASAHQLRIPPILCAVSRNLPNYTGCPGHGVSPGHARSAPARFPQGDSRRMVSEGLTYARVLYITVGLTDNRCCTTTLY